jgi:hypothetical protein
LEAYLGGWGVFKKYKVALTKRAWVLVLQDEKSGGWEEVEEVVGKEVVGKEVVGKEVVGKEVVGKEVVGKEVVGKEVVGWKADV